MARRLPWRTVAASLALILVVGACWWWQTTKRTTARQSAQSAAGAGGPESSRRGVAPAARPIDVRAAATRMRAGIARASSGQWLFMSDAPVLAPGPIAAWNGFQVASPTVLREADGHYRMWFRGCRLLGGDRGCAIGSASSTDGLEWTVSPEPVLVPGDGSDEFDLGAIAVTRTSDGYHMWYSLWPDGFERRARSPLYMATSKDGLRWEDHGRVLTSEEPFLCIQPAVARDGDQFHLWFADSRFDVLDRHNIKEGAPFFRHFTSPDGRSWQEQTEFRLGPLQRGRPRISITRQDDGSFHGFYFGRTGARGGTISSAVGWLVSADGNDWRLASTQPVPTAALGGDVRQVIDATGVQVSNGMLVWFAVELKGGRQDIRAGFYKE